MPVVGAWHGVMKRRAYKVLMSKHRSHSTPPEAWQHQYGKDASDDRGGRVWLYVYGESSKEIMKLLLALQVKGIEWN